jgi:hypothetical protein
MLKVLEPATGKTSISGILIYKPLHIVVYDSDLEQDPNSRRAKKMVPYWYGINNKENKIYMNHKGMLHTNPPILKTVFKTPRNR